MIRFRQKGSFSNTEKFLVGVKNKNYHIILEKFAREGVLLLSNATPYDTGLTADKWRYSISITPKGFTINWINDNKTSEGTPIVILLQYGHATKSGGFVEGKDFINPAMKPLFDKFVEELWKEVAK